MHPRYTLPSVDAGRNIDLEIKPKQVAAWLKRLPLSNPVEAAEELADYLATANRAEIAHDTRAKMAAALADPVSETVQALRSQYATATLPLAPRLRKNPELAQHLLMEYAMSHKILVQDWLKRTLRIGRKPLPYYLQQILLSLQSVLEISFENHENTPPGIWVDLHQTFNYALRNDLAGAVPEQGRSALSLEQIYKHTLLMALADPYHFPQIELPWVKDIIARFGDLAELFPAEAAREQAVVFVIEVNTDSPPKPLAWETHPTDPRWDLMLNTTELAKHLAILSSHVRSPDRPDRMGLPAAAQDPEYAVMLRRLRLNWGASVQRKSQRRRHLRGKEFEVAFGFRSIYQLLMPTGGSRIEAAMQGASGEGLPIVARCQIVDDSMGGLALHRQGTAAIQVKVGELAAIRQGNGAWSVGLLRWFRLPRADDMFFGIQLLAPRAHAVQVKAGTGGRPVPALLVQASPTLKQSAMLLAPPGTMEVGQAVEASTPTSSRAQLQIDKRLEYTPNVEIFRIAVTG